MVEVTIPIVYYLDPTDPDSHTYTYHITLNPTTNQNYFTGKLMNLQMDAIANSLKSTLMVNPNNKPTVESIAGVDMHAMPLPNLIDLLYRHDDSLSSILFVNGKTLTNYQQFDHQVDQKSTDNHNIIPITQEESTKNNIDPEHISNDERQTIDIEKSEINGNSSNINMIQVKPAHGRKSFVPLNITKNTPDDTDFVNQIGMSRINKVSWGSIKKLVNEHKDLIYTNPLIIIPDNASVTDNRKEKMIKNAGLTMNDLDGATEKLLGTFEYDKRFYKIICFVLSDSMSTNKPSNNEDAENSNRMSTETTQTEKTENSMTEWSKNYLNNVNNIVTVINQNAEKTVNDINSYIESQKVESEDFSDMPKELQTMVTSNTTANLRAQKVFTFLTDLMDVTSNKKQINYIAELISNPDKFLKALRYLGTINDD